MKRVLSFLAITVGLTACAPQVPDSGAGVGFKDYDTYLAEQRARDQALATGQQPVAIQPPATPVDPARDVVVVVEQRPASQTPEQQTASAAVAAVRGTEPVVPRATVNKRRLNSRWQRRTRSDRRFTAVLRSGPAKLPRLVLSIPLVRLRRMRL